MSEITKTAMVTVCGRPNVGKSSLTGVLRRELDDLGIVIDVDQLTAAQGGDPFAGGKAAIRKIENCLKKGVCFTQETTLSGGRTERTVQKAKESGYQIRLYYVGLGSTQESLSRIRNRVAKGGHDIPPEDVLRRFNHRFADVARILPYCDQAVFYDRCIMLVRLAFDVLVVHLVEFEILTLLKGDYRPSWILELADYLKKEETLV